jgi:hypothetical protein
MPLNRPLPLTGGCNCGAVRYEVTEPLVRATYCHCKRCQRRTGAAASAQAHPAPGTFRIVAGQEQLRMWQPQEGVRSGSAATVGRRSSDRIRATTSLSASGWERSTTVPAFVLRCGNLSPMPPSGNRSPMTACRGLPRAVTHPARVRSDGRSACSDRVIAAHLANCAAERGFRDEIRRVRKIDERKPIDAVPAMALAVSPLRSASHTR